MKKTPLILATIALAGSAQASIVINVYAGQITDNSGALVAPGTLLQLVNLGLDGVFNPIDLQDGSTTSLTQWVSGDDSLINVPFGIDFPTAAAFDLAVGTDPSTGIMDRAFEFATGAVPSGTKFGLRWFPGLLAQNFASTTLTTSNLYGQFTRQGFLPGNGPHGGDAWVAPADGGSVTADSFASASIGGSDPDSTSRASVAPVPEPTSAFLVAVGAAGLMMRRRRQS